MSLLGWHLQWESCYYQWDFLCVFLPAARALAAGQNPYLGAELTNPPWFLVTLLPFVPLPDRVTSPVWLILNLSLTMYSFHVLLSWSRLIESGYKRALGIALLTLLPWSLYNLQSGQVVSFVLLGLVGSYAWRNQILTLPCLAIKPHLAILPLVIWLQKNVSRRRLVDLGLTALVTILFLLSPLLFYSGAINEWVVRIIEGRVYRQTAFTITSIPMLFRWLGLPTSWAILPMIAIAVLATRRPALPVVATAALLVSPYSRSYDFLLLGIAIPYMVQRRTGTVVTLLGIAFPFLRKWALPHSPVTLNIIVPLTYFIYCWLYAHRWNPECKNSV